MSPSNGDILHSDVSIRNFIRSFIYKANNNKYFKPEEHKILVVDDHHLTRESFKVLLEEEGFKVSAVGNGWEALDHLMRFEYSLAIIDKFMPIMDGLELLRIIKERYASLPCIMLSTMSKSFYDRQSILLGAFDYLEKSGDFDFLLKSIAFAINNASEENVSEKIVAICKDPANFHCSLINVSSIVFELLSLDIKSNIILKELIEYKINKLTDEFLSSLDKDQDCNYLINQYQKKLENIYWIVKDLTFMNGRSFSEVLTFIIRNMNRNHKKCSIDIVDNIEQNKDFKIMNDLTLIYIISEILHNSFQLNSWRGIVEISLSLASEGNLEINMTGNGLIIPNKYLSFSPKDDSENPWSNAWEGEHLLDALKTINGSIKINDKSEEKENILLIMKPDRKNNNIP